MAKFFVLAVIFSLFANASFADNSIKCDDRTKAALARGDLFTQAAVSSKYHTLRAVFENLVQSFDRMSASEPAAYQLIETNKYLGRVQENTNVMRAINYEMTALLDCVRMTGILPPQK